MGLLLRVAELLGQPGGQQLAEQGYLDRMWAADQETVREPGEARLLGVGLRIIKVTLVWPSFMQGRQLGPVVHRPRASSL